MLFEFCCFDLSWKAYYSLSWNSEEKVVEPDHALALKSVSLYITLLSVACVVCWTIGTAIRLDEAMKVCPSNPENWNECVCVCKDYIHR